MRERDYKLMFFLYRGTEFKTLCLDFKEEDVYEDNGELNRDKFEKLKVHAEKMWRGYVEEAVKDNESIGGMCKEVFIWTDIGHGQIPRTIY